MNSKDILSNFIAGLTEEQKKSLQTYISSKETGEEKKCQ